MLRGAPFRAAAAALALFALLLAGCKDDVIVWSPDGARAAIITSDGLRLCGADGRLSPVFVPDVYRAAWLADSRRLVLARSRAIGDYAALAARLGPERTRALAAESEVFWHLWKMSSDPETEPPTAPDEPGEIGAVLMYVREHHDAEMRTMLAAHKKDILKEALSVEAGWHSLAVARVVDDRVELGAPLAEGLVEFKDIRPSPNGSAVAFVTRLELSPVPDEGLRLFVVPIDGSAPAIVVASHVAAHPDWTPEGGALVYLKSGGEKAAGRDLQLGTLQERDVLDPAGRTRIGGDPRNLASLIFQETNRVRCLRDGRVIFNATEYQLPAAGDGGHAHEQLFALDRSKHADVLAPLIRREMLKDTPGNLDDFRVSPDESQVLFDAGQDIDVLTLVGGSVERLALGAFDDSTKTSPLPEWRCPGEIVYLKARGPRNELILRRGAEEVVLSRTWPDAIVARLVKESSGGAP